MGGDDNVEFVNQPVNEFVQTLRETDGLDIWLVGGSELIDPFMKDYLIDEFIISIHPILLGEGIPMFRSGFPMQALKLEGNTSFPSGLIQVHYLRRDVQIPSGRG
jgi:dihydrofolate reductase